jgi:elongation factor Ts
MAEIPAALVRALRERTGAGMMDCKRALTETGGDMEAAVDWLRKKGLAAAAKKSGRVAADGLIGVASASGRKRAEYPGADHSVGEQLTHLVATIGENLSIRRARVLEAPAGVVASYVHQALRPGLGRIGVLVAIEGSSEIDALELLGRQVGMHVAAARPEWVDMDAVDPAALERERAVLTEQARQSGKPDPVIEKMVEGRIRKYYEEVVLLEQVWVHDGETRVREVLRKAGAKLLGFARFQLGEGIDRSGGPPR